MKIKEVCGKTGLTDRAVRFYIENGLLFPSNTENYAGRRTYDFSDDDIEKLKEIIILRKAEISVEDIKLYFDGKVSLNDTLAKNQKDLQSRLNEINTALDINTLLTDAESIGDYYEQVSAYDYATDGFEEKDLYKQNIKSKNISVVFIILLSLISIVSASCAVYFASKPAEPPTTEQKIQQIYDYLKDYDFITPAYDNFEQNRDKAVADICEATNSNFAGEEGSGNYVFHFKCDDGISFDVIGFPFYSVHFYVDGEDYDVYEINTFELK